MILTLLIFVSVVSCAVSIWAIQGNCRMSKELEQMELETERMLKELNEEEGM